MNTDETMPLGSVDAIDISEADGPPVVKQSPLKQIAKQSVGIVIGLGFLWLSFKDTNFAALSAQVQKLNVFWVLALAVSSLISHVLRAQRWLIMLQPLASHRISLWNSFCAVMIGYAVNIAIPRGGEVARVISISKSERIPWVGVLPTLFIDRLLDVAFLVLFIGITLVMLPTDIRSSIQWLVPTGALMCVATVVGMFMLPKVGTIMLWLINHPMLNLKLPGKVAELGGKLAVQFDNGTRSISNTRSLLSIAFLSFCIWGFYFLNTLVAVYAFGLQDKIDLSRCFMVFTIGSVGVLVPTPGSVGTYHYATSQALNMVAGVDPTTGLAFATVVHAVAFVLVTLVVAAICVVVQSLRSKQAAQ